MTDSLLRDTKSVYSRQFMEVMVFFYDILYSNSDIQPAPLNLTPLFGFIKQLPAFVANALLHLSITICEANKKLTTFPYQFPTAVISLLDNCPMAKHFCQYLRDRFKLEISPPEEDYENERHPEVAIPWICRAPYNFMVVDKALSVMNKPAPVSLDHIIVDRLEENT